MEMTLEEFLAQNSSVANIGANFWETIGISITVVIGLFVLSFAVAFYIEHKEQIKELMKPYESETKRSGKVKGKHEYHF